jgi:hypothetical protein
VLAAGGELHGADIHGDSSPQDVLYLPTILEWFPDARVVLLVRDPRGFLCSYKNYHRRGVASYRERYNPITNSVLWRSYMRAGLAARSRPGGEAVHLLHYERLVTDPEGEVRRLCEHVGVEFKPEMLEVGRANSSFVPTGETTARKGIHTGSRERWKTELTPTELWVGERIFGGVMRELGYEPVAGRGPFPPSPWELMRILAFLPGRLFNMLFRSHKPFKLAKVRRVLSQFHPR